MESFWSTLESELLFSFGLSILVILLVRQCLSYREEPTIVHHPNHPVWNLVKFSDPLTRGYSPTVWLCFGTQFFSATMQTVFHTFIREVRKQPLVDYKREFFNLSDGGTVGLDWARSSIDPNSSLIYHSPDLDDENFPILFLHHGLCGCSRSQYILSLTNKFLKTQKYRVVCLVARGCGNVPLSTPDGFIAARTLDMRESLQYIYKKYPNSLVYGIGFSLGAGIMAKYIGEEGENCKLAGAAVVSPCWNFLKRSPWFKLWSKFFLASSLIEYTKKNLKMFKKNMLIDLSSALDANCVEIYDKHIVIPTHGYRDVQDYYQNSSALAVAHQISIPTLSLNSRDDPVCSINGCPDTPDEMGPGLVIIKTNKGGHLCWPEGYEARNSWMDEVVFSWIEGCNDFQQKMKEYQPPTSLKVEKGILMHNTPTKEEKPLLPINPPVELPTENIATQIHELLRVALKTESLGLILLGYSSYRLFKRVVTALFRFLIRRFVSRKLLDRK